RLLLASLLRTVGFEVEEAANGREAVERSAAFAPRVVFMDMRMPVLDGLAATREIRERERTSRGPRCAIVAQSASALAHESREYLASGCDDFLSKPFREEDLFERLGRWAGVRFVHEGAAPAASSPAPTGRIPEELRAQMVHAVLVEGDQEKGL